MYWNATVKEFGEGYKVILALSRVVSPQFKITLPGSNFFKIITKKLTKIFRTKSSKILIQTLEQIL